MEAAASSYQAFPIGGPCLKRSNEGVVPGERVCKRTPSAAAAAAG